MRYGETPRRGLVFSLLLAGALAARATVLTPLGPEELVRRSDLIFVGACISSESRWDNATRMIFTDSRFVVEQYLKNSAGAIVTVTEPGGVLPEYNLGMEVSGMPEFHVGEEVLLYVARNTRGVYQVVGVSQGKYTIQREPATGKKKVGARSLADVTAEIERLVAAEARASVRSTNRK